ncbi:hypothetical protein HK104_001508 [Borealophlyctis nickersoniae]|nr:hypothetical protein HK104_001508 [Borealophlyctis nickersoniae]
MATKLPLPTRKNIKEYEPKLKEHLDKFGQAIGGTWTFDCDFAAVYEAVAEDDKPRIGEVVYNMYMGALTENVCRLAQDEMVKEAIEEAAPNKKIVFMLGPVADDAYEKTHDINFNDDNLNIVVPPQSFWINTHKVGEYIEKRL